MAAVQERRLSIDEFHARYLGEKPYYEYWDGEAVQKSMPTRLHQLIEEILVQMLRSLGYDAGNEITIKLDPAYEPIPDVIASEEPIPDPYPTRPFEVAIEILSPEDTLSRLNRKCRLYENWGIRRIIVIDPRDRSILSFRNGALNETTVIATRGDRRIEAQLLWDEVDRLLHPQPPQ